MWMRAERKSLHLHLRIVQDVIVQVQVVERKEVHCLWEEGAQTDGASRVDQILGFHTTAKVEEEAIDHRATTFAPRKRDHARLAAERTDTTAFLMQLQFDVGNEMRAARAPPI